MSAPTDPTATPSAPAAPPPGAPPITHRPAPRPTPGPTDPRFADLLDLLGRRWMLRILWELRGGPKPFNALRKSAGGLSQSVLVTRLTELFGAGLVADVDDGYRLTPRGAGLAVQLAHLAEWSRTDPGPA